MWPGTISSLPRPASWGTYPLTRLYLLVSTTSPKCHQILNLSVIDSIDYVRGPISNPLPKALPFALHWGSSLKLANLHGDTTSKKHSSRALLCLPVQHNSYLLASSTSIKTSQLLNKIYLTNELNKWLRSWLMNFLIPVILYNIWSIVDTSVLLI